MLRFPHRFQLILFMLAPLVMSLTLAYLIDTVSGHWLARARRRRARPVPVACSRGSTRRPTATERPAVAAKGRARPPRRRRALSRWLEGATGPLLMRLLATACIGAVFFTPFWSNDPYRMVFASGSMAGFLSPFPLDDLKALKQALNGLPEGKTVVIPPTETAKLVEDSNGVDHKFIDKFFIYYLDKPSYYYGLTGDVKNKFEFFLILRALYYKQDWWINEARDIGVKYIVINRKIHSNNGVGAEYLPDVESFVEPAMKRLPDQVALRYQNDSYALYEITDQPKDNRPVLLVDSSWQSYLNLVFTRRNLSRCYKFEYSPYYDPTSVPKGTTIQLLTDDVSTSALDLYLLDHPDAISGPDSRMFAFNPDVVASNYYLSPMFRSFLLFSNTKWNRTEMITPGVFGTLRGSFIGVPRATEFSVPVKITKAGRYRVLMRTANTANSLHIVAPTLKYDKTLELRSPAAALKLYRTSEVYNTDRVAVDTSQMSVADLEKAIPDELVPDQLQLRLPGPRRRGREGGDRDVLHRQDRHQPDALRRHDARARGRRTSPWRCPPTSTASPTSTRSDARRRPPQTGPDDGYVDPAANPANANLTQDELLNLAAADVQDLEPPGRRRRRLELARRGPHRGAARGERPARALALPPAPRRRPRFRPGRGRPRSGSRRTTAPIIEGARPMTMRPRRIVFLGTHGQYNIGDELLLDTFLTQLGPEHEYVVNSYDPAYTSAQVAGRFTVRVIDTARDRVALLRALLRCDVLVFGGGSIIKELYASTGRNPYSTLLMILAIVTFTRKIARKPIAMLNVGVGPLLTPRGLKIARMILRQVDQLTVRDERSLTTCRSVGVEPVLATDAVFSASRETLLGEGCRARGGVRRRRTAVARGAQPQLRHREPGQLGAASWSAWRSPSSRCTGRTRWSCTRCRCRPASRTTTTPRCSTRSRRGCRRSRWCATSCRSTATRHA